MAFDFAKFFHKTNMGETPKAEIIPLYSIKNHEPCGLTQDLKILSDSKCVDYIFHCNKIISKDSKALNLNYFLRDSQSKKILDTANLTELFTTIEEEESIRKAFSDFMDLIIEKTTSNEKDILKFDGRAYRLDEYENILSLWNQDRI